MTDRHEQIEVFLQPGDHFVADAHYRIRTLLGSCVSITLWHPATRIGGMSHFLLPTRGTPAAAGEFDGHYGDEALQLMLREFRQAGVPPTQCQAKIFGGGNMFPGWTPAGAMHVGQRNGEAAHALLRAAGIAVVSQSLFGEGHRQIIFDVGSGDVWSHQVKPGLLDAAAERQPP
jgi:chemotaxis protein CheD